MGTLSVPTEHGLTTFWVSLGESLRAALSLTRLFINFPERSFRSILGPVFTLNVQARESFQMHAFRVLSE